MVVHMKCNHKLVEGKDLCPKYDILIIVNFLAVP